MRFTAQRKTSDTSGGSILMIGVLFVNKLIKPIRKTLSFDKVSKRNSIPF